jgi:regulator of protease activity HflC (stomatin/prohibitin superfamily)
MSTKLVRFCRIFVILAGLVLIARGLLLTRVPPGNVGVRYSNAGGLSEQDLEAGWHWELPGLQRISLLPSKYLFLNYTGSNALSIRTKDNNTVSVDISVPYRILDGAAWKVMDAGNHFEDSAGVFRFERFANDTAISVLRENLAQLRSADFYNTDRRLEISEVTLKMLNKALEPLHLQASAVLIRASYFREDYEQQLARIQLNEQQKLLDGAKRIVADEQQKLDNFSQQTSAMESAKVQDWNRRIANLNRSYQVGFLVDQADRTPGAARRQLGLLSEEARIEIRANAGEVAGMSPEQITEAHLLGIKNVEAETTEHDRRVRAGSDGIAARLIAEGDAKVAKVRGAYESKLNTLLGSPGGRAYVAFVAAGKIKFSKTLTFQSGDGVPSVLRLRDFALTFMGK